MYQQSVKILVHVFEETQNEKGLFSGQFSPKDKAEESEE